MRTIKIRVKGIGGIGIASFPYQEWNGWSAIRRCLRIHSELSEVTRGERFDVIGTVVI